MITIDNYYKEFRKLDYAKLPDDLKKYHKFLEDATDNGEDWDMYHEGDDTKKAIDTYLILLNNYISKGSTGKAAPEQKVSSKSTTTEKAGKAPKGPILLSTLAAKNKPVETVKSKRREPEPDEHSDHEETTTELTERIPEEIRFIKRYVSWHEKTKTKEELLRFISGLQRAITERKIRKTSDFAKQITYIQKKLVERFNSMGRTTVFELSAATLKEFKELVGSQVVYPSIMLIKRYISLAGKPNVAEKAQNLLKALERAVNSQKVSGSDKYAKAVIQIKKNLDRFLKDKSQKTLIIQPSELNGLEGILGTCNCQSIQGLDGIAVPEKKGRIMNSIDFCRQEFDAIGFQGKFLRLIGDPSRGFSVMVFGRPKFGKSILCADFAAYLARHHGRVLYVAKEEGLDRTLKDKLNHPDIKHQNLDVTDYFAVADLQPYDFVFLDSVNMLGLSTADLLKLKETYPDKSFIYVFQTNKAGSFRGSQEFQHNVDAVIEVPQKGLAIQNGRFNQGGELNIFDEEDQELLTAA